MLRVLTLALVLATPAEANTLVDADVQDFTAFAQKSLALQQDLLDATGASLRSPAGDCLQRLVDDLQLASAEIKVVEALAKLEIVMLSPADDKQVISGLRLEAQSFLQSLALHRKVVNGTMGTCASFGLVATKGQELLRLYDQVGALVVRISNKIGR
jgi:hypothetical protein